MAKMAKDKFGNYVIQKMIAEVKPAELQMIHKAVKKFTAGEKKLNGYTKHVIKTIQKRMEKLELASS